LFESSKIVARLRVRILARRLGDELAERAGRRVVRDRGRDDRAAAIR
jgi:hypothetical protein